AGVQRRGPRHFFPRRQVPDPDSSTGVIGGDQATVRGGWALDLFPFADDPRSQFPSGRQVPEFDGTRARQDGLFILGKGDEVRTAANVQIFGGRRQSAVPDLDGILIGCRRGQQPLIRGTPDVLDGSRVGRRSGGGDLRNSAGEVIQENSAVVRYRQEPAVGREGNRSDKPHDAAPFQRESLLTARHVPDVHAGSPR